MLEGMVVIARISVEGAILAVLSEADELAETVAMHEEASCKLGLRATRASRIAAEDLRRRERELREVANLIARLPELGQGISPLVVDRLMDMGHGAIVDQAERFVQDKLLAAEAAKGGA